MRISLRKARAAFVLGALAIASSSSAVSANAIFRGPHITSGFLPVMELPVCYPRCATGFGPGAAIPNTSEFSVWRHPIGSLGPVRRWH
jgi:hypothetical protein